MASVGDPITYRSTGFGVESCPECGETPEPGQDLTVRPGEWRTRHAACMETRLALEELI
jgi:hypothetical protein